MTSQRLIPRVGNGTPHRGKVTRGITQRKWAWHGSPFATLELSSVFRVGVFLQGLRHSLIADLFWLPQEGWVSIFYVHILKNHLRKYLFHFHDICFLLCRDISLAAKAFFLNRSKCQVWFNRHSQRVSFEFYNTSKSCKFLGRAMNQKSWW